MDSSSREAHAPVRTYVGAKVIFETMRAKGVDFHVRDYRELPGLVFLVAHFSRAEIKSSSALDWTQHRFGFLGLSDDCPR